MTTEGRRLEVRAMNSEIELVSYEPGADRRLRLAARWLAAYEERYSRFRLLSELSRMNAASGSPFRASKGLFGLVSLAVEFARRSGGLFDPTVLDALQAAGYDRSFELIAPAGQAHTSKQSQPDSWQAVQLEDANRTITLPEGVGIDLGGIGKGWAVDRLASMLGPRCLINGGGDVYAGAAPPEEPAWRVGIADPFAPEHDLMVLRAVQRGVATSSSLKRRWQADGLTLHHLIDPRTGRPSSSDAVQVTVVARKTVLADFHAKVALLKGAEGGLAYIDSEADIEGILVRSDGAVFESEGLKAYL